MKKSLLTALISLSAIGGVRADVIFNENFNYADGSITNNAPGIWYKHSGNAPPPGDALVHNHREEISATGGTLSRQDDVNRRFTSFTNTQTIVYASFTVN